MFYSVFNAIKDDNRKKEEYDTVGHCGISNKIVPDKRICPNPFFNEYDNIDNCRNDKHYA